MNEGTRLRDALPTWLRADVLGVELWQILAVVLLIGVGLALRRVLLHIITASLRKLTRNGRPSWSDHLVARAGGPVGALVVAGVVAFGLPFLDLPDDASRVLTLALRTLSAFAAVWLMYRLVDVVADVLDTRAAKTESKLDDQLVPLLRKALKVTFVVVGFVFILQNLDVDVGSLLAGLGLGGLAFALAAKDTVANFFGSIMIFVDKPFQIGDWITMAPDIEGTVEEVGFRTSRIRTFYNSVVTVPNANVTTTPIDNLGRRRYRRYKTTLGLTYDTPPERVQAFCEGVRAILLALPACRKDYYLVEFHGFGASSLDILLYCFFETPDWSSELRARTRLNLSILRLASELDVSFAFPTQTLHLAPPSPARAPSAPGTTPGRAIGDIVDAFGPGGALSRPDGFVLTQGYEAGTASEGGEA